MAAETHSTRVAYQTTIPASSSRRFRALSERGSREMRGIIADVSQNLTSQDLSSRVQTGFTSRANRDEPGDGLTPVRDQDLFSCLHPREVLAEPHL